MDARRYFHNRVKCVTLRSHLKWGTVDWSGPSVWVVIPSETYICRCHSVATRSGFAESNLRLIRIVHRRNEYEKSVFVHGAGMYGVSVGNGGRFGRCERKVGHANHYRMLVAR